MINNDNVYGNNPVWAHYPAWHSYSHTSDPLVLRIILQIVRRESTDELLFDYLKVIAQDDETERILHSMLLDERTHFDTLKQVYFYITGRPAEVDAPIFERPESLRKGLSNMLLRKDRSAKLYTHLWLHLSPYYAYFVFPFIIDEQNHMSLINYLLIKHVDD